MRAVGGSEQTGMKRMGLETCCLCFDGRMVVSNLGLLLLLLVPLKAEVPMCEQGVATS